jgi:AcrR family transcriptional regulator
VYRYFTGKDAIIAAMAEDERCQARALLHATHAAGDLPDALTTITQAFADRYAATGDASLMMEIYAEGLRNKRVGNVVKSSEAQWINSLADLLRSTQIGGQMDPSLDPTHTALFLTAMWDGMAIRQAYHGEDKPAALVAIFDTMLKRALLRDGKSDKRSKAPTAATAAVVRPAAPLPDQNESGRTVDTRQLNLI